MATRSRKVVLIRMVNSKKFFVPKKTIKENLKENLKKLKEVIEKSIK